MNAQTSPVRAPGSWRGAGTVAGVELRQRLRSKTLLVLAIVWFVLIALVTGAMWLILSLNASTFESDFDAYPLFSLIIYFVLLFGTLVAPAISAGSISSERTGGTLATTQVTLVSTNSILFGKAFAAWITGLAFLVIASPFVILSVALARVGAAQLIMAFLALALQLALFTAIGVGFSALISSPLFAIVTAYLVVAALSVGTLIAFGLGVGVSTRYVEVEYRTYSQGYWEEYWACDEQAASEGERARCYEAVPVECVTETMTTSVTPTNEWWWVLAMNPYVVVADMVATTPSPSNSVEDMFSFVSYGVRSLQLVGGEPVDYWSDCPTRPPYSTQLTGPDASDEDPLSGTVPVWWIGLGLQTVLAVGTLWGGYRKLHTPAKKLPRGSRVA